MPLNIRREGDEIYVGNYGWLCSVPLAAWKKDGAFFIGEARDCGMEGGDDTFDEVLVLGLNDKDQLLLTKDSGWPKDCGAARQRHERCDERARGCLRSRSTAVELEVENGTDPAAGLRAGRRRSAALLLSRAPVDRRQLPHVPGRSEGRTAQAAGLLRHVGQRPAPRPQWRAAGSLHQHADGEEGPRGRDGIPADQPSARLPDLRPGRRMRPAGPGHGLWHRQEPLSSRTSARWRTSISARWSRPR